MERQAAYTCLATTHEIIWIDELQTGPPAMSWKHDYGAGSIKEMDLTVIDSEHGGEVAC